MTTIAFLSDTHTFHNKIHVPECDILVHSGDYTFNGTIPEVNKFLLWFSEQKCTHRILVNGNHEVDFWKNPALFKSLIPDNVTYLEDSEVTVDGIKFYGSPHTKEFYNWAYPYFDEDGAQRIWDRIPLDTDILVTHMPPYGIRDGAPYKLMNGIMVQSLDVGGESVGCEVLRDTVNQIRPRIHVFGHIHEGAGYTEGSTLYINAAICDGQYKPVNPVTVVTIDENKKITNIESI